MKFLAPLKLRVQLEHFSLPPPSFPPPFSPFLRPSLLPLLPHLSFFIIYFLHHNTWGPFKNVEYFPHVAHVPFWISSSLIVWSIIEHMELRGATDGEGIHQSRVFFKNVQMCLSHSAQLHRIHMSLFTPCLFRFHREAPFFRFTHIWLDENACVSVDGWAQPGWLRNEQRLLKSEVSLT